MITRCWTKRGGRGDRSCTAFLSFLLLYRSRADIIFLLSYHKARVLPRRKSPLRVFMKRHLHKLCAVVTLSAWSFIFSLRLSILRHSQLFLMYTRSLRWCCFHQTFYSAFVLPTLGTRRIMSLSTLRFQVRHRSEQCAVLSHTCYHLWGNLAQKLSIQATRIHSRSICLRFFPANLRLLCTFQIKYCSSGL